MSAYALRLSCCCGGELVYAGTSSVAMGSERDAFNRRHGECRPLLPVPPSAHRYPIAGRR